MPGGEVADVEPDLRKSGQLANLAPGNEPVCHTALVEDLDGARMQTTRPCAGQGLVGASFDDGDIDSRQRQFG
jgi:hypothetical protein